MHSEDSKRIFAAKLQQQLAREKAEAPPSKDGIEVREVGSMLELSEEDQRLLMRLRERHEMHKERTQTLPSLKEEDTVYDTIRVKQVVVRGA